MIALHARRSAPAIAAWQARHGSDRLGLVLTGTDLYRDIQQDASAYRSLTLASRLVVLQPLGLNSLPEMLQAKTRVIYQSAQKRRTANKTTRHLRAITVGHLRPEKSPETLYATARLLRSDSDILIDHLGNALEPALADAAVATMHECPGYRWLGGRPHAETRRRIQQAHLLVHPSRMEGGAHVIIEAIMSGTPVLASRIDGNVGMLGKDYPGYFDWGDAAGLASLLRECRDSQKRRNGLLTHLGEQASARSTLFSPETECRAVRELAAELAG